MLLPFLAMGGSSSVRFDSTDDDLTRSSSVPSEVSFTACGWGRRQADTGAQSVLFSINDVPTAVSGAIIGTQADGDDLIVAGSGFGESPVIATLTTGVWFYWCMTGTAAGAGSLDGYYMLPGATSLTTQQTTGASFTQTTMVIGNYDDAGTEFFNGDIMAVKVWDRVLTTAEMFQESAHIRPLYTFGLTHWYPLWNTSSQTIDFSGNAQTLTSGGTKADADNPPVSW